PRGWPPSFVFGSSPPAALRSASTLPCPKPDAAPGSPQRPSTATTRCRSASSSAAWPWSLSSSATASSSGIGGCCEAPHQPDLPQDGAGAVRLRLRLLHGRVDDAPHAQESRPGRFPARDLDLARSTPA